jgi:hypothetical protein
MCVAAISVIRQAGGQDSIPARIMYSFFAIMFRLEAGSSVGIATTLRAGRSMSRGLIPGKGKRFYLLHKVQIGHGAHPASYLMGAGGCFPGG